MMSCNACLIFSFTKLPLARNCSLRPSAIYCKDWSIKIITQASHSYLLKFTFSGNRATFANATGSAREIGKVFEYRSIEWQKDVVWACSDLPDIVKSKANHIKHHNNFY